MINDEGEWVKRYRHRTPAMVAGEKHRWSVTELILYPLPPPIGVVFGGSSCQTAWFRREAEHVVRPEARKSRKYGEKLARKSFPKPIFTGKPGAVSGQSSPD